MCTKIIQNTKFVYILYTKIVQIKILYDNECTKNVHQIPSNIQKQTVTKFRLNTASNLQCMFFVYKKCTNCTKPIQLAN